MGWGWGRCWSRQRGQPRRCGGFCIGGGGLGAGLVRYRRKLWTWGGGWGGEGVCQAGLVVVGGWALWEWCGGGGRCGAPASPACVVRRWGPARLWLAPGSCAPGACVRRLAPAPWAPRVRRPAPWTFPGARGCPAPCLLVSGALHCGERCVRCGWFGRCVRWSAAAGRVPPGRRVPLAAEGQGAVHPGGGGWEGQSVVGWGRVEGERRGRGLLWVRAAPARMMRAPSGVFQLSCSCRSSTPAAVAITGTK